MYATVARPTFVVTTIFLLLFLMPWEIWDEFSSSEFFTIPRNRRADQSSFFVMFMQQVCRPSKLLTWVVLRRKCGPSYSTQTSTDANFTRSSTLLVPIGTGIVNWLFAIPAIYAVDTFGPRNRLPTTSPLIEIMLPPLASVLSSRQKLHVQPVLFLVFTSLWSCTRLVRRRGLCWSFSFILKLTWPALVQAFTSQNAFRWCAAWDFFFIYIYFFKCG